MKKVVKFGGSSLASAEQFEKVGAIIRADKDRRYVVPSAPGRRFDGDSKVTDMLYDCYATAEAGKDFTKKLADIKSRYDAIIEGLQLDYSLDEEFEIIKQNFEAKAGSDYAASRGEYLNGKILAYYLNYDFIDAAEVILFDEEGIFDAEYTNRKMEKRLRKHECAVIPGFYGAYADGRIKTFSRGGSDITGSIVARALKADLYENWTDVSGFLVTDPHLVENPQVVDVITYRELRELSYMGAAVLHDEAIFPVRKAGIPINIRNTNRPEDPGTMIVSTTSHKSPYTITGIAGKKGFAAVSIDKTLMNSQVGFFRRVLSVFEDNNVPIEHLPSGIDTLCVFLEQKHLQEKEQQILAGLQREIEPDNLEIQGDIALIAIVGRGMRQARGTAGRIFSALAHANINCRMIDQGSSELNIIVGVKNDDFEAAVKAIYDIFITTQL